MTLMTLNDEYNVLYSFLPAMPNTNYRISYYHPSLLWTPEQWAFYKRNERKIKHTRPLHDRFGRVRYQAKVKRFR